MAKMDTQLNMPDTYIIKYKLCTNMTSSRALSFAWSWCTAKSF